MTDSHAPTTPHLPGDALQQRAKRALFIGLAGLLTCLPTYLYALPLWQHTMVLEGGAFMLAALGFGLLLVLGPLLAICGLLAALFLCSESVFMPRSQTRASDRAVIALAKLVTLLPALAALYPPLKALVNGKIHYKFPATDVARALDPLGYWQGIAFWFMGAAALGWLAFVFWRSRWQKLHNLH